MNGLSAAKGLARSVEDAGGVMRISVTALGDAFGRGKMTTRARTGIEQVLARSGIEVVPGLNDPANDGWVTLRKIQGSVPSPAAGTSGPRLVEMRPQRHLRPAPFLAALAFLVPVLLVIALASPEANRPGRATAETAQTAPSAPDSLLDRANTALLAGDYTAAVRFTRRADPDRVPALRRRIAASLVTQAQTAQRRRAYVRAIQLSRRAARYGRAPGASAIIRQSRAGLDLRREEQRRAERDSEPRPTTTDAG